jgi:hypothetical protein
MSKEADASAARSDERVKHWVRSVQMTKHEAPVTAKHEDGAEEKLPDVDWWYIMIYTSTTPDGEEKTWQRHGIAAMCESGKPNPFLAQECFKDIKVGDIMYGLPEGGIFLPGQDPQKHAVPSSKSV